MMGAPGFVLICLGLALCPWQTAFGQASAGQSAPMSANPGSCTIEGRILRVLKPVGIDSGSVCYRYPCRAKVLIKSVSACGSSVTYSLKSGDTVTIRFAYTLADTHKAFPSMKAHFPGLKKGNYFTASIEHRMAANSTGELLIYDYRRR